MPDWSYRTLLRPILYRMPPATARDLALEMMGRLARRRWGGAVIDFLGHMRPDPRLRCTVAGVELASPTALGPALDPGARATDALARFGFGLLEVGPVSLDVRPDVPPGRDDGRQSFVFDRPPTGPSADELIGRLASWNGPSAAGRADFAPVMVRLAAGASAAQAIADHRGIIAKTRPIAALFSTDALRGALGNGWSSSEWSEYVGAISGELVAGPTTSEAANQSRALLICLPTDRPFDELRPYVAAAREAGAAGFVVDGAGFAEGSLPNERRYEVGGPLRAAACELTGRLRRELGSGVPIVAAGGVHEPRHALALRRAGADVVAIDTGLVFSGPGLTKRTNEGLLAEAATDERFAAGLPRELPAAAPAASGRPAEMSWFWALLLGASLLGGGLLALAIAATRVVLPYDEMLSGMTREQLAAINERLLPFMAHDRISVAGTMVAVGIFYLYLAWNGIREGRHWAYVALHASALLGIFTFFAFLGFGYFDPFHAFVTGVMFQFQLLAVIGKLPLPPRSATVCLVDDRAWRTAQWGQLIFILHGFALVCAGAAILSIGCTFVLVQTDLDFLCTTYDALTAANPRLIPLIAHDRAAFGGMLMSAGVTMLLSSLWGFARGRRWLWWMFLTGSAAGYSAAFLVHLAVGYDDFLHLIPVLAGSAATVAGAWLSREYLYCRDPGGEDRRVPVAQS